MGIVDRPAGASRIGLGLAAVGRPGYINLGRAADLPAHRTVDTLRARAHHLLDQAHAAGIRYFDVARSYGRAEEFLAEWLRARPDVKDVVVGSKWGYTYTAGWRVDAEVHEVKDHSVATFDRQLGETLTLRRPGARRGSRRRVSGDREGGPSERAPRRSRVRHPRIRRRYR